MKFPFPLSSGWPASAALALLLCGGAANAGTGPAPAGRIVRLGDETLRVEVEIEPADLPRQFGPRFDATARVRAISAQGVAFVASNGWPDEFGLNGFGVLGFDEAAPGGEFIKVGVGVLRRPDGRPYKFNQPYATVRTFPAAVTRVDSSCLDVRQEGEWPERGWGYRYTKSYQVDLSSRTLVIRYEMANIGRRELPLEHYNHHWTLIGEVPVGSQYVLQSAFPLQPGAASAYRRLGAAWTTREAVLTGVAYHDQTEIIPKELNRYYLGRRDRSATVESRGDYEASEFACYASPDGFCPEVFFRTIVQPGESVTWSRHYTFTVNKK